MIVIEIRKKAAQNKSRQSSVYYLQTLLPPLYERYVNVYYISQDSATNLLRSTLIFCREYCNSCWYILALYRRMVNRSCALLLFATWCSHSAIFIYLYGCYFCYIYRYKQHIIKDNNNENKLRLPVIYVCMYISDKKFYI